MFTFGRVFSIAPVTKLFRRSPNDGPSFSSFSASSRFLNAFSASSSAILNAEAACARSVIDSI